MKITPPKGCIAAVYYESELLFCIGEKWDAKVDLESGIADNTSYEEVEIEHDFDFEAIESKKEFTFFARWDSQEPLQKYTAELVWITLY